MLCITRKRGESIMIGDDIEIIFRDYKNGQARFAITAPRNVQVDRKEVYEEKIKNENANTR